MKKKAKLTVEGVIFSHEFRPSKRISFSFGNLGGGKNDQLTVGDAALSSHAWDDKEHLRQS